MKNVKTYIEFINESKISNLFGGIKKTINKINGNDDNDIADKILKILKNITNEIKVEQDLNAGGPSIIYKTEIPIEKEKISLELKRVYAGYAYQIYFDNIKLNCSEEKANKVLKILIDIMNFPTKMEKELDKREEIRKKDDLRTLLR